MTQGALTCWRHGRDAVVVLTTLGTKCLDCEREGAPARCSVCNAPRTRADLEFCRACTVAGAAC